MTNLVQTVFYWLNIGTWVRLLLWLVTRKDVRGRENIPARGPLILASNHLSLADPPLLSALMPRRVVWMAKQELFDTPVVGSLYHLSGCIPVRRFEADLRALRRCQQALRRGRVLGMFPEGTRRGAKGLQPGEPGTALLALRSGAPVLPVAVWGTENAKLPRDLFRRTDLHVVFGKPFALPQTERITKKLVEEGTEEMMRRIAELLPPEYRGVYGQKSPEGTPAKAARAAGERKN